MRTDAELFETYKRLVYRICFGMMQNKADAEDLCQETFVKALREDRSDVMHEKSWLIRIAINLCNNQLKRNSKGRYKELVAYVMSRTVHTEGVEQRFERKERAMEIDDYYAALPVKIRSVMTLKYVSELSVQEIAHTLGIPVGTVKSRLNKGLNVLRKRLDKENRVAVKGEECLD
ncbi:RNA polymerase sigma factor [Paenibacillus harenae]|uniref:RNA polymerase sigma-70 factor (ECF subfamily) n=1 Tax=Paenibacillus harenae TaxID=306543 RepID=A0ABT9U6U5_PAEHA|nr:RNA polymerase sigma factor [Paenibacillus harenae]MDQ0115278.1 RNA polymerase sigma-70 factor (ECF subfamily) [Paenibacillus harenae]